MGTGEDLLDDDTGLDVEFVAEVLFGEESNAAAINGELL
jgi:hypothetical protein